MARQVSGPWGVLAIGDVPLIKQGTKSPGVYQQYRGETGCVGNCQARVDAVYLVPGDGRQGRLWAGASGWISIYRRPGSRARSVVVRPASRSWRPSEKSGAEPPKRWRGPVGSRSPVGPWWPTAAAEMPLSFGCSSGRGANGPESEVASNRFVWCLPRFGSSCRVSVSRTQKGDEGSVDPNSERELERYALWRWRRLVDRCSLRWTGPSVPGSTCTAERGAGGMGEGHREVSGRRRRDSAFGRHDKMRETTVSGRAVEDQGPR
jgi:hypothetical protein